MSSPQFLSTLSCLAEREENIKRLIENQKVNSNGFYYIRLNINGVWRYYAVDENLPELDGVAVGARSFNDAEAELWPSLIEKAYAKAYDGYKVFKNQNVPREHYLRDLTGAPIRKFDVYFFSLFLVLIAKCRMLSTMHWLKDALLSLFQIKALLMLVSIQITPLVC